MSKKTASLFLILIVIYTTSLVSLYFIAKRTIVKKDIRLWAEARASLQESFNGNKRLVSVDYSGKKIKAVRIDRPTIENTIRPKTFFNVASGNYEPSSRALMPKDNYEWHEAYDEIRSLYELRSRYDGDREWSGFLFYMYDKVDNGFFVTTLYPIRVGYFNPNNPRNPSVQDMIDECFEFFTRDKESPFCGQIREIDRWDISKRVNNEYYCMWSYQINSNLAGGVEAGSSYGKEIALGRHHSKEYYTLLDDNEMNKLGYFSTYNNKYGKVFLESHSYDAQTLRYQFGNGWDRMENAFRRMCIIGFIIISIFYCSFLLLMYFLVFKRSKGRPTQ